MNHLVEKLKEFYNDYFILHFKRSGKSIFKGQTLKYFDRGLNFSRKLIHLDLSYVRNGLPV